jgi:uncharacterized repeat protein (TIGR03843 family)
MALELLGCGEIEVLGLIPYSSNYTFLTRIKGSGTEINAVYKPRRGERPLWDFPDGTLAEREVAAFKLSRAAGWDLVPPTIVRADAPIGPGSLQLFVEHDPERHFFALQEERALDFQVFALFDSVINNADRKAGHVLEDDSGRLWAVDHGVTFNERPKLRTVIWDFAGHKLPGHLRADLMRLVGGPTLQGLIDDLSRLLNAGEVEATVERIEELLQTGRFPLPFGEHDLPWPLI